MVGLTLVRRGGDFHGVDRHLGCERQREGFRSCKPRKIPIALNFLIHKMGMIIVPALKALCAMPDA